MLACCFEYSCISRVTANWQLRNDTYRERTFREVRKKDCCHKAGSLFPTLEDFCNDDGIEPPREVRLCVPFKRLTSPMTLCVNWQARDSLFESCQSPKS